MKSGLSSEFSFAFSFLLVLCNIRTRFCLITISSHFLSAPLTYRTSIRNEHQCLSEVQLVCQLKGNSQISKCQ
jgi:hypothetical protein